MEECDLSLINEIKTKNKAEGKCALASSEVFLTSN